LQARDTAACIPSTRSRKISIPHDTMLYRQRHRIEIMFGRLKDWRRIAVRYDRCAHTYFSAITLAATVIFWLEQ
jgi:transposase